MADEEVEPAMRLYHKLSLLADFVRYTSHRAFPSRKRDTIRRKKQFLVIRLDRIGDFALFQPFAAALRRFYPAETHEITLLGRSLWMPLARQLGFDHYAELDPAGFLHNVDYRKQQLAWIASADFDLLLQPRFHREPLVEDLITLAAHAPRSVAFASTMEHLQPQLMRFTGQVYTELIDSEKSANAHELVRNRLFLEYLTGGRSLIPLPLLQQPIFPAEFDVHSYVVFLPGSGKSEKIIWPPEKFGHVARKVEEKGYSIVVCGTADESALAQTLLSSCRWRQYDLTGQQSIEEFAATIQHAAFVIGNDTGGIHIAAMSGVPSLAITGQGQPGIFLPYPEELSWLPGVRQPHVIGAACPHAGCRWQCAFSGGEGAFRCIRSISAEQILEELEKRLPPTAPFEQQEESAK